MVAHGEPYMDHVEGYLMCGEEDLRTTRGGNDPVVQEHILFQLFLGLIFCFK